MAGTGGGSTAPGRITDRFVASIRGWRTFGFGRTVSFTHCRSLLLRPQLIERKSGWVRARGYSPAWLAGQDTRQLIQRHAMKVSIHECGSAVSGGYGHR